MKALAMITVHHDRHENTRLHRILLSILLNHAIETIIDGIHEMCQGLEIDIPEFFNSPLFAESNLDP